MKILFLSGCAPASFNHGEPNAYPFYIIQELAKKNEVRVLYFSENKNLAEKDILSELTGAGVRDSAWIKTRSLRNLMIYGAYAIRVLPLKLLLFLKIKPPAFLVPLPLTVCKKNYTGDLTKVINDFKPDLAVIFPQQLYFCVKRIHRLKVPVSLLCTDSIALHFERLMKTQESNSALHKKSYQQLLQSRKQEMGYNKIKANYFFVGEKDRETFKVNSGQNSCFFLHHHLYSFPADIEEKWKDNTSPLNVLFAGGGYTIYTADETDKIAARIGQQMNAGSKDVVFHFLGNGYDKAIRTLQSAGHTVVHQKWVADYDEYMKKTHIQVFPIIMGTGTKAKVLMAMVSGILCIGTWYSFENIGAENGIDYLQYNSPDEIPGLLTAICRDRSLYEKIALSGKERILREHNTEKVVRQLLSVAPLK